MKAQVGQKADADEQAGHIAETGATAAVRKRLGDMAGMTCEARQSRKVEGRKEREAYEEEEDKQEGTLEEHKEHRENRKAGIRKQDW